ncbi:MAG: hypothetical protein JWM41_3933 [Gemmatimonadetes bacterium]|nr:hypothetical protein [Gemmatimonadota bacterium]
MCGIAGIVAFDGRTVAKAELAAMTDRMIQRGPDDDGFMVAGPVGLGMRRLSIIDVAGGHQPLTNETGDLHLVLNGEIYNHLELRQQLIGRGHIFRTASDAEVVLHLYEEEGVKALASLNGMFAFALFDARRGSVWVARDRLGIKPLYYALANDRVVFASDITALRSAYPTDVVPEQLLKYLALSYVPGVETIWRGVHKLPPAHYLLVESGKVTTHRYWAVGCMGTWRGTEADAARQLEELLHDAIRLQLRSDVPLGVFLSGGLDSSTIVALAADQVAEPLRTFTVRFEGKVSGDEGFARRIATQYGTTHAEISMGREDAGTALDELLSRMDEPLSDSALLPAYWLSKAARAQGIKVLLNGAGGDEIFGGYRRHWRPKVGSPTWVAESLPNPLRRLVASAWSLLQPDRAARAIDPALAWATGVSGVNLYTIRHVLREPDDYRALVRAARVEYQPVADAGATSEYARARMHLDLETYLPDDVLSLTDKATMAASVEGRVPFLDHRLVEFAFSLPSEINLAGGQPKGLLKRCMQGRLPRDLLTRSKEGFNAPDEIWLQNDRGMNLTDELLENRSRVLDRLIDPVALERTLASPERRRRSAATLFALFLFNRWYRAHASD